MNLKKFFGVALCAMMVFSAGEVRAEKKLNRGKLAWGIAEVMVMPILSVAACFYGGGKTGEKVFGMGCQKTYGALAGGAIGLVPALAFFCDGIRNILDAKEDDDLTKAKKEVAVLKALIKAKEEESKKDEELTRAKKERNALKEALNR